MKLWRLRTPTSVFWKLENQESQWHDLVQIWEPENRGNQWCKSQFESKSPRMQSRVGVQRCKPWSCSASRETGGPGEMDVPKSSRWQTVLLPSLFCSHPQLVAWGSPALGRAICFTHSTDSSANNVFWGHPTDTPRNYALLALGASLSQVKLMCKINHHRYRILPKSSLL